MGTPNYKTRQVYVVQLVYTQILNVRGTFLKSTLMYTLSLSAIDKNLFCSNWKNNVTNFSRCQTFI